MQFTGAEQTHSLPVFGAAAVGVEIQIVEHQKDLLPMQVGQDQIIFEVADGVAFQQLYDQALFRRMQAKSLQMQQCIRAFPYIAGMPAKLMQAFATRFGAECLRLRNRKKQLCKILLERHIDCCDLLRGKLRQAERDQPVFLRSHTLGLGENAAEYRGIVILRTHKLDGLAFQQLLRCILLLRFFHIRQPAAQNRLAGHFFQSVGRHIMQQLMETVHSL